MGDQQIADARQADAVPHHVQATVGRKSISSLSSRMAMERVRISFPPCWATSRHSAYSQKMPGIPSAAAVPRQVSSTIASTKNYIAL